MKVYSPITNSENVSMMEEFSGRFLRTEYKKQLNIDINPEIKDSDKIYLFKCNDSQLQFYYPFDISGDSEFYESLEKFDWYYMPWKWEHEIVLQSMVPKSKILEVGCGQGSFVKKLTSEGYDITGLELNHASVAQAQKEGLNVIEQTMEEHCLSHYEKYDHICSFQLLEHITDVRSFMNAQLSALKKGGKLTMCVPNNESFIKHNNGGILNYPPHHMLRWTEESLVNLKLFFPITVSEISYEPLQPYHFNWYIQNITNSKRLWRKRLFRILKVNSFLMYYLRFLSHSINGHSIMISFIKQ